MFYELSIISGKQWLESFCIFIRQQAVLNCEKIISQLGKNIFPVGAIWFCSWDLVFRQLLHEYTAWICVVSLRSGVLENQALLSQVSSTRPLRGKKLLSSTPEGYRNFYKQHALKGQKLLAQGNALGIKHLARRPVRAKALKLQANFKAFSLSGKMYGTYLRKFCQ